MTRSGYPDDHTYNVGNSVYITLVAPERASDGFYTVITDDLITSSSWASECHRGFGQTPLIRLLAASMPRWQHGTRLHQWITSAAVDGLFTIDTSTPDETSP
jgi:hypothetical protein